MSAMDTMNTKFEMKTLKIFVPIVFLVSIVTARSARDRFLVDPV
jgi:hypothetical protein